MDENVLKELLVRVHVLEEMMLTSTVAGRKNYERLIAELMEQPLWMVRMPAEPESAQESARS